MWSVSHATRVRHAAAHLSHSAPRAHVVRAAACAVAAAPSAIACALPATASSSSSTSSAIGLRFGSGGAQSHRANRASSRASGSTYRAPKGRPGENVHHIKEPLPDIRRFADPRLPVDLRRKLAARARKQLPKHDRIDFEVAGGEVVPLRGHNSQRKVMKRVKTALHKQLRLARAHEQAAANMKWDESEQAAAEADAERFLAAERAVVEEERQRVIADSQHLPVEQQQQLLEMFDAEVIAAQELVEAEAADAEAAAAKRARKSQPTFGIQTVLKFLGEFDITVKTAPKGKRAAAQATQPVDPNPMNQDIIVYDVISRFNFADYIVAVKAQSARQMRHLAESAYKMARSLNACSANPRVLSLEGRGREDWMLVDAGHIWLYFFNRTPVATLPNAAGIFGVSFNVPQPNVQVSHMQGHQYGNVNAAGVPRLHHTTETDSFHSVSFSAHGNPFAPAPSTDTSAAASFDPSQPLSDPDVELRETSSQINSTMWYEPTPDSPGTKKKGQINMLEQQQQMSHSLDPTFYSASSSARATVIDADFSATASPLNGVDPALESLHASNFTHPVLENLEKNYGDLRVPADRVARIKDYVHEDLRNDVEVIGQRKAKGRKAIAESIEIEDTTTTVVSRTE